MLRVVFPNAPQSALLVDAPVHDHHAAPLAAEKQENYMADLQQTWSDSYASFGDVGEWIETDPGREPDTIDGSSDEETLEVYAMPDAFAQGLHDASEHGH